MKKRTAKKTVKALNAKIKRDNAQFQSLKPAEKRVAIARDVLKQLASGRLQARSGMWLANEDGWSLLDGEVGQKQKDTELQTLFNKMEKCTGCALGSMFMCAVERANKLKVRELRDFEELTKDDIKLGRTGWDIQVDEDDTVLYLKKFFSHEQLGLIESAFERGKGAFHNEGRRFCPNIDDPSERMKLIMQNIVANKGKFRPEQKPVQVWTTPGFEE